MKQILIKSIGNYYNSMSYLSKNYAADAALHLFTTPRKGQLLEAHTTFLKTATPYDLSYQKELIKTYQWQGEKSTILLVHGWESNTARWAPLIKELNQKGHHIIALDAPAHGASGHTSFNAILYSEWINIVAQHYNPEIIIGHSVGGMSSALYQYKYNLDSLKKLILLGAPSKFTDVLERYIHMLGFNDRIRDQLNLTIEKRFGNKPENFETGKFLENSQLEGLIIHDKHDSIIPYEDALQLHKNFKNSKLITTDGLGHSLNHPSVTTYINDFITS